MPTVNFYLKKAEESTGKSLIKLRCKYNGNDLIFTFGQSIDPKNWDSKKQRVKSNRQTTADGQYSLNDLLDNLEQVLNQTYHSELKNGIPDPAVLKHKLIQFIKKKDDQKPEDDFYSLAERFISGEIKHRGKDKAHGTLKPYKTVLGHIKAFEVKQRYPVSFDTINLNFYYKYMSYLKAIPQKDKEGNIIRHGLAQNTMAKHVQIIKTFMNEAIDQGYTTNVQFRNRKFSVNWVETDSVYLTDKELIHLFDYDLSSNKRLEQVRDLFIFGCYVGLRFSDYSNVKPENIIDVDGERFIRINTQKTGEQVVIPCSPIVLRIFDKYASNPNNLPKALSNQKFNNYIKEVCREAGFNAKGRLITDPDKELWECVSSHTARRSFATNLFLEGFPSIQLMKITGHRTEKAFLNYIKVSKLDTAKQLSKHIQLKWSEKILKAVG